MTSLSEALIVKKYRSGFNIHSLSYEYWNSCVVKCITYIFRITLLGHSAVNNAAILFFLNYLETYVLLVLNSVLTCGICPLDVFIRICEQLLHSIRTLMTYVYNSRWRKIISKLEKSLLYTYVGEAASGAKLHHETGNAYSPWRNTHVVSVHKAGHKHSRFLLEDEQYWIIIL